jgi:hypothetical protein
VAEAAALHDLAEVLDGALHLLVGVLEQLRGQLAGLARGRVVVQRDLDVGGLAAVVEADRAGVVDVRVAEAPPGDALVGDVLGDLGVPLDGLAERARDDRWLGPSAGCGDAVPAAHQGADPAEQVGG